MNASFEDAVAALEIVEHSRGMRTALRAFRDALINEDGWSTPAAEQIVAPALSTVLVQMVTTAMYEPEEGR